MSNKRILPFAFIGLLSIIALVSCVDPTPTPPLPTSTPAPAATCAPTDCSALSTRVAEMEATVQVWETVMPDVMQTAAALYELSLTPTPNCSELPNSCPPTPSPTHVLCQRCRTDADCGTGYICKLCATCYYLCVRVISPNGDCNNCLLEGVK